MKIKCSKSNLMTSINTVIRAVPSKTTMPILECILIDCNSGEIKLTSTNLELGIETIVDGSIIEKGCMAIKAKNLSDIVRNLPDSDIYIEGDGEYKVKISSEKAKFNIPCFSGEDFPELTKVNKDSSITISKMALKDIIRQTIFSISDNDNSKMMTGELFEVSSNVLSVTALDGQRIAIRKLELKGDNSDMRAIVPGKTLGEIRRIIGSDSDDEVNIYFNDKNILFEFDNTRVVSRLIEGSYFKIGNLLSIDLDLCIRINRLDFLACMERTALLIMESDRKPVVLKSGENDDILSVQVDTNLGSMNEEISIEKDGGEVLIGINNSYIMDVLREVEDETVSIYMKDLRSPMTIKDDEGKYIYIVMPININRNNY